jgi:hypothetical protein
MTRRILARLARNSPVSVNPIGWYVDCRQQDSVIAAAACHHSGTVNRIEKGLRCESPPLLP